MLLEAAKWIKKFAGQTVVIKLGGEVLRSESTLAHIVEQITCMADCGMKVILVHGAGRQVDDACAARGLEIKKIHGRRITSPEARDLMVEVLAELNAKLCRALETKGHRVLGMADGINKSVICRRRTPVTIDGETVDFGEVGDIQSIETTWGNDLVVLACLGYNGENYLNINADTVAARVAAKDAVKLVYLTSVAGIMASLDDPGPISWMTTKRARKLLDSPAIQGGMKAKLQECLAALEGGVEEVHVINGREPFTLLREVFTAAGCGTLITDQEPA